MENSSLVQIKGIREGLLISAENGTWDDRKAELLIMVKEKESFFKGARVCLDVYETPLRVKQITQLRDQLLDLDVTLWAILSTAETTLNNARALGLETSLPVKKDSKEGKENKDSNDRVENAAEKAVLVNKTLRAGYKVESLDHVIIFGDVNPGAEIVSAGNIIVWGKLKGSAIAGAEGNKKAVICAMELRPTQLRIGDRVFPPQQKKGKTFPEVAYIENDDCKIELWNKEKGR
ncbi:MAG: septum site-determining protein MinC [Chloroflexi bacterium HGW-Chloroflexi-4]|jgi:septum site-determining protein MinC|nr:MAG: septum site-determining protein MinC [Chloroflexi bacterium HGW-Chloroflexi-4]